MDEHDLRRRLSDAAASPSRSLDQAVIDRGVARRRQRRRLAVGSVASSLVLVAALAGYRVVGDDPEEPRDVQIVDTPTTTTPSTTDPHTADPSHSLQDWPRYPPEGIAVAGDAGITLIGLDGTERRVADLRLADPDASGMLSPGVAQVPVHAAVSDSRPWWWDPWASPHGPASASMQLAGGAWISPDPPFLQTSAVQVDAAARWRVSSDGRVVTWTECDTGCPHRVYDSVTQQIGELLPGCWVAATDRRDDSTLICADGTQIVPPPGNHAIGLSTPAGQPARAVAAWSNGVAWIDHGTCDAHEAVRIVDGEVRSLLADDRGSAPSAVPLGVAFDGRVIVHLNAAACETAASLDELGVYLVDPETGEMERVWQGTAPAGEVSAWTRPAPVLWALGEGGERAELDEIDEALVVFGNEGVGRLVDGAPQWWWTDGPVTAAFSDGDGGVVFQAPGDHPFVGLGAVTGAILHLTGAGEAPTVLVEQGENATLLYVGDFDGRRTVLFDRQELADDPVDHLDATQVLHSIDLETGTERALGAVGERADPQVSEAAVWAGELVVRRCENPCTLRSTTDQGPGTRIDTAEVTSGLDTAGDLLVTVELDWGIGGLRDPILVVISADGQVRTRVGLPYTDTVSPWPWVDLADDGRSALVLYPQLRVQEPPRFDVVLVTGLDTSEPRVQILRTDHALRFG